MDGPITFWQGLVSCAVSLVAAFTWFTLAVFAAVALYGPESGDGQTANAIFVLCLPGIGVLFGALFLTITYFERKNGRR